jgi:hypothetical protein
MGTTYLKHPQPSPDMDAGRSATKVSDAMTGKGQDTADGTMGKAQKTGDGMENEKGGNPGHGKKMGY